MLAAQLVDPVPARQSHIVDSPLSRSRRQPLYSDPAAAPQLDGDVCYTMMYFEGGTFRQMTFTMKAADYNRLRAPPPSPPMRVSGGGEEKRGLRRVIKGPRDTYADIFRISEPMHCRMAARSSRL